MRERFVLAVTSLLLGAIGAGCPMEVGFQVNPEDPGGGGDPGLGEHWCCDPDEPFCECPGYWVCTEGAGGKRCEQDNPQTPDDGTWECSYTVGELRCRGRSEDHPDAGQGDGWQCTDAGEGMIECSRPQDDGDVPDEGDGPWDCYFSSDGEMRVCEEQDGGGGGGGSPGDDAGEWECTEAADGTTICVNHSPDRPDDGDWDCVSTPNADVCTGSRMPDDSGDGGWNCEQQGEFVQCDNGAPQQPDGGGDQPWDCAWGDNGRVVTCVQRGEDGGIDGGGGSNPGDEGQDDNPGDDNPGDDNPGDGGDGDACVCPPNAERFCDTPTYCNWGRQVCVDDGAGNGRWGACVETNDIPAVCFEGMQFDAAAEQCAIDQGYCVQDFWDLDFDWDTDETLGRNCSDLECIDDGGGGGGGGFWGF